MRFAFKHKLKLLFLLALLIVLAVVLKTCNKKEFLIIEQGDILIVPLSQNTALKSVRRPVSVGFYDEIANKTFVSYLGKNSNPFVQEFIHKNNSWSQPKQVGDITKAKSFSKPDRHNYPSLIQMANGNLASFYAEHADELRITTSPKAHSINGNWNDRKIPEADYAAYPMPFKTENADIYVFYRESSYGFKPELDRDDRPVQYIVSRDNAKTWTRSSQLTGESIAIGSWDREDNLNEIYIGQIRYQKSEEGIAERFHIVWTLSGGGYEGPKHDRYHKDVYYSYFLPENKHFYCVNGLDLGFSISANEMQNCLVEDSGKMNIKNPFAIDYVQLVSFTDNARPILVYRMSNEYESWLRSSLWDGKQWQYRIIESNNDPKDIEKLDAKSFALYMGNGSIYVSHNAGYNWQKATSFRLPDNKKIDKLALIENYQDPARLIISETKDDNNKRDVFLLGFAR